MISMALLITGLGIFTLTSLTSWNHWLLSFIAGVLVGFSIIKARHLNVKFPRILTLKNNQVPEEVSDPERIKLLNSPNNGQYWKVFKPQRQKGLSQDG